MSVSFCGPPSMARVRRCWPARGNSTRRSLGMASNVGSPSAGTCRSTMTSALAPVPSTASACRSGGLSGRRSVPTSRTLVAPSSFEETRHRTRDGSGRPKPLENTGSHDGTRTTVTARTIHGHRRRGRLGGASPLFDAVILTLRHTAATDRTSPDSTCSLPSDGRREPNVRASWRRNTWSRRVVLVGHSWRVQPCSSWSFLGSAWPWRQAHWARCRRARRRPLTWRWRRRDRFDLGTITGPGGVPVEGAKVTFAWPPTGVLFAVSPRPVPDRRIRRVPADRARPDFVSIDVAAPAGSSLLSQLVPALNSVSARH